MPLKIYNFLFSESVSYKNLTLQMLLKKKGGGGFYSQISLEKAMTFTWKLSWKLEKSYYKEICCMWFITTYSASQRYLIVEFFNIKIKILMWSLLAFSRTDILGNPML